MEIKPNKPSFIPRKATKENLQKILDDIKDGSTIKHAALMNSITETQFWNLVAQGICDMNHHENDTLCAWLVKSLNKIQDAEIKSCTKDIRKYKKGHKGAEWILERKYWRQFSSNAQTVDLNERVEKLEAERKRNEEK